MASGPSEAIGWLQLLGVVGVPLLVFAALFGSLRAEIRALKEDVLRLCGDHDDIRANKQDIGEMKKQIAWGTRRFQEIFRWMIAFNRGGTDGPAVHLSFDDEPMP